MRGSRLLRSVVLNDGFSLEQVAIVSFDVFREIRPAVITLLHKCQKKQNVPISFHTPFKLFLKSSSLSLSSEAVNAPVLGAPGSPPTK